MLKYADKENEDGIMFTANIDKAFYSVEYHLIFATLKKTQHWQSVHSVGQNHAKWGKKLSLKKDFSILLEREKRGKEIPCLHICLEMLK